MSNKVMRKVILYYVPAKKKVVKSVAIEDLNITVKLYNSLKRAGIKKIEDILNKSDKELMQLSNIELKDLHILKNALVRI